MRLAGDDELHGPLGVGEEGAQALLVVQHEREALVGRHASREADREHVGVEHARHPLRRGHAGVLLDPRRRDALARVGDELLAHGPPHRPQLSIRHSVRAPVTARGVVGAEAVLREGDHERVGPGGSVHAVRDRGDRYIRRVEAGPELAEHASRDLAVQLRDAVGTLREP